MKSHFVIVLTLVGLGWCQSIPELVDFSERFANHSCKVQPKLHDLNERNAGVRLELIHWIVAQIGNLTAEMRHLTNESWSRIEQHELMQDQECQRNMRYLRDYYVGVGEVDIRNCAYDMDYYMWHDSVYRFVPRAQFVKRENSRAIHQTVQTLGRNNFVENRDRVVCELEDELVYHRNLWSSYREVLCAEIGYIGLLEKLVRDEMARWYVYAIYWHALFMGLLEESVDYYCGNTPWWCG